MAKVRESVEKKMRQPCEKTNIREGVKRGN